MLVAACPPSPPNLRPQRPTRHPRVTASWPYQWHRQAILQAILQRHCWQHQDSQRVHQNLREQAAGKPPGLALRTAPAGLLMSATVLCLCEARTGVGVTWMIPLVVTSMVPLVVVAEVAPLPTLPHWSGALIGVPTAQPGLAVCLPLAVDFSPRHSPVTPPATPALDSTLALGKIQWLVLRLVLVLVLVLALVLVLVSTSAFVVASPVVTCLWCRCACLSTPRCRPWCPSPPVPGSSLSAAWRQRAGQCTSAATLPSVEL
jgi:hypothetical protein